VRIVQLSLWDTREAKNILFNSFDTKKISILTYQTFLRICKIQLNFNFKNWNQVLTYNFKDFVLMEIRLNLLLLSFLVSTFFYENFLSKLLKTKTKRIFLKDESSLNLSLLSDSSLAKMNMLKFNNSILWNCRITWIDAVD